MTQIVDKKLKLMCDCCKSHFDKPCAWLSLGNEYCTEIMEIQKELEKLKEEKDKEIEQLKEIAKKMHLWIFLHSGDEQKVYDELGLTDEENAMLGYNGQIRIGGDDNE